MAGRIAARLAGLACLTAALLCPAAPAGAANVLVYGLSDLSFNVSNFSVDQSQSESLCTYSGLLGGNYSVTATGSVGGAFLLTGPGNATLPYEVQWASSAGQTSGTNLTAGVALTGQSAGALICTLTLVNDASLIVILRSAKLTAATAGSYSGTLTIMLAPN